MSIERGSLRIHKRLVIRILQEEPERLSEIMPDWDGTASEAVKALQQHSGTWIVDGVLTNESEEA